MGLHPNGFQDRPVMTTSVSLRTKNIIKMASQKRFELPTHGLEGRCSIQLSYWDLMGRSMGIEPTNVGATIRCVNHFATTAIVFI